MLRSIPRLVSLNLLGLIFLGVSPCFAGETASALWGKAGELWQPASRLPDFSFAGYHRGEAPLPTPPVTANVRDFGALGDGKHDDTAAFRKAIEQTAAGAIDIPAGRYLITDILDIRKSNLVLRGAGPAKTTLYFPKFLNDVRPNMGATTTGEPTSNYSWSGGFIWLRGAASNEELAKISAPAQRGSASLSLSSTKSLKIGQDIEIRQDDDPQNTLATYLYANDPGPLNQLKGKTRTSLVTRIVSIDGDRITIDRPLRTDVDLKWRPRILRYQPTVKEVGIEGLRFEFPNLPYAGHFTELGHNAIALSDVSDCWVRNIIIDHCDSGIFVGGRFCTVTDVVYHSDRAVDKQKCTGHHGLEISGDDNLFTRFRFDTRFIHDITVEHAAGNVISAGSGIDLSLDHHKYASHANLFTDLDAGAGTRLWMCGGGADLGRHSAAWETFWNIRASRPQAWPPKGFAPDMINLIGLPTTQPTQTSPSGRWFEAIPPANLTPQDLHQSQLHRRLGSH